MEFTLSRDKFSIIITALLIVFALGGIASFYFGQSAMDNRSHFALILSSSFILTLCLLLFLFRPIKYKIENGNIRISRMLGDKIILKEEIKTIRIPSEREMSWPIRTFGNGGIFGYTGRYYTKSLGNMIWYCSRKNNFVIIERKNKYPVVISPDHHKTFLKTWQG